MIDFEWKTSVETVVLRFISTFCSLHTIQDSVQMVLFSTQILPFRTASANHCCTLMAASLKIMIMIMIKTAMTLLNIVMSNRQRFSHYLTQIWSTNVLLLRFFRKKIKMKIISKNMIVTTIPSGGANVNLFFALFSQGGQNVDWFYNCLGFQRQETFTKWRWRHTQNCPPQNCISRVGNSDIHLSS